MGIIFYLCVRPLTSEPIFIIYHFTIYIYIYIYIVNCSVQINFLIVKKLCLKLGFDLYDKVKIQTFTTGWSTSWTVFLTIDIHHFPSLQQTHTNISYLKLCLVNISNKLIWNNKTVIPIHYYINIISHTVSNSWCPGCKHKPEGHSTKVTSQTTTVCIFKVWGISW